MRGQPTPTAPITRVWSTKAPDLQHHYEAWREGRIDFQALTNAVGAEAAGFIVEAAEVAGLDLDTVPNMDNSGRLQWQQGAEVEQILQRPACRADCLRWTEGDISNDDLVDKWGGDVYRQFQSCLCMAGHLNLPGKRATQM